MEADLSEEVPYDVSAAELKARSTGRAWEARLEGNLGHSPPRQCILDPHS